MSGSCVILGGGCAGGGGEEEVVVGAAAAVGGAAAPPPSGMALSGFSFFNRAQIKGETSCFCRACRCGRRDCDRPARAVNSKAKQFYGAKKKKTSVCERGQTRARSLHSFDFPTSVPPTPHPASTALPLQPGGCPACLPSLPHPHPTPPVHARPARTADHDTPTHDPTPFARASRRLPPPPPPRHGQRAAARRGWVDGQAYLPPAWRLQSRDDAGHRPGRRGRDRVCFFGRAAARAPGRRGRGGPGPPV
jgi:hypothetical protein